GVVPLLFVLAGDFRYLLLWEVATRDGAIARPSRAGLLRAALLTAIVPITAPVPPPAIAPGEPRVLFLVYELAFSALAFALLRWHPNARAVPWVRAVTGFVLLYYALWAGADTLILSTGSDLGHALRLLPNLLYYGGFIAAVAWLAPRQP